MRMTLDASRGLEYNREEILRQDGSLTVNAILHRPLRAAKPWGFGFRGVCPAAFDKTDDRCVPHQLEAVLQRTLGIAESDMDWLFEELFEELYPASSEGDPYEIELEDGPFSRRSWWEAGITTAMGLAFAKAHNLAVHVLWGRRRSQVTPPAPPQLACASMFTAITPSL